MNYHSNLRHRGTWGLGGGGGGAVAPDFFSKIRTSFCKEMKCLCLLSIEPRHLSLLDSLLGQP